jgi:UDP-GlcNAc:undecaprenyl-phosphate GlcNAc-1-phosphate transferase
MIESYSKYMIYNILFTLILSVVLAMIAIPRILLLSYKKKLFDIPNIRKVHKTPVPRLGGISFMPIVLIAFCLSLAIRFVYSGHSLVDINYTEIAQFLLLAVGLSIVYFVGLYDDLVGIRYTYKFAAQILAGCLLLLGGLWINNLGDTFGVQELPKGIGMLLSVFVVVYITNAINLIDGIDGLAAGLCSISLAIITIICMIIGQWTYATLSMSCLGVLIVFMYYNVFSSDKKRLFMGDTGSMTLGFLLTFIILHFWQKTPTWNPFVNNLHVLVLSTLLIPLLDVIRVFLTRIHNHKNPFLPDKNHIHHKLIRTGMSPHWVMITILLLSLFYIAMNYWLIQYVVDITLLLIIDFVLWILINKFINIFIFKRNKTKPVIIN